MAILRASSGACESAAVRAACERSRPMALLVPASHSRRRRLLPERFKPSPMPETTSGKAGLAAPRDLSARSISGVCPRAPTIWDSSRMSSVAASLGIKFVSATSRVRSWSLVLGTELSTAVRIQGSAASRLAMEARALAARGSMISPRVNASWKRTRASESKPSFRSAPTSCAPVVIRLLAFPSRRSFPALEN